MSLLTNLIGNFAKLRKVKVKNDNTETVITEGLVSPTAQGTVTFPVYFLIESNIPEITNSGVITSVAGGRGGHGVYVDGSFNDNIFYNNGIQRIEDGIPIINLAVMEYQANLANNTQNISLRSNAGDSLSITNNGSDASVNLIAHNAGTLKIATNDDNAPQISITSNQLNIDAGSGAILTDDVAVVVSADINNPSNIVVKNGLIVSIT